MGEHVDEGLGVCVSVRRTGDVDIISPIKQMWNLHSQGWLTSRKLTYSSKCLTCDTKVQDG